VRDITEDQIDVFSLEKPFEIAGPLIKPYCCCGFNHSFIDGARTLVDCKKPIARVDLGIRASGDVVVGNSNTNAYAPQQIEHLQYSLPFQFALSALDKGNGYQTHRQYMDGTLDIGENSEIASLAQRVHIHVEPKLDIDYPGKMVADITVTFDDDTTEHVFVEDSIGSAANPMVQADLDEKFRDLTTKDLGSERSEMLLKAITNDVTSMSAADLVSLLIA
jgi:2-methylcitrate dehydratase PrpD